MLKSLKNLTKNLKQDFFSSLNFTLRPKPLQFYKYNRPRESDNNYAQYPSYGSAPIHKKKNDYRVGYQDSSHNIRYIDHSTAKLKNSTFSAKNIKFEKKQLQGILTRYHGYSPYR